MFKDPSKVRAQKQPKIDVPAAPAPVAAGPIVAVSNDNDAEVLYSSDDEVSEDDDVIPPSAGINSLNIGGNQWRVDSALNSMDPRAGGQIIARDPQIKFPLVFLAHAWNEPGWKNGKAPKKGQKVFIANCYTSAPVSTWDKPRTFLRADGSVGHGEVKVPQTHLIREYF